MTTVMTVNENAKRSEHFTYMPTDVCFIVSFSSFFLIESLAFT